MQDLTISLVQCNQFWEDKRSNLEHFDQILDRTGKTDLIVFPEMFHTGFSMNTKDLAEPFSDSPALDWLRSRAETFGSAIYTSFITEENSLFYNRGVFVFPSGKVESYDKRKLFSMGHEDEHFSAGNESRIVEYKGWRINLQICYDLRFPEISRNFVNKDGQANYDLSLYVANWPEKRIHHWKPLLLARAIENQAYVVGLNRVGEDGNGLVYSGDSMLVNALGEVLSNTKSYEEQVQTIVISKEKLLESRKTLNFLKDVRF